MSAFLPSALGTDLLAQIRDVIGVQEDELAPLREAAVREGFTQPENGLLTLLVSLASAMSFSRALQRMYARVWELPTYSGVRALRGSLIWLVGWGGLPSWR